MSISKEEFVSRAEDIVERMYQCRDSNKEIVKFIDSIDDDDPQGFQKLNIGFMKWVVSKRNIYMSTISDIDDLINSADQVPELKDFALFILPIIRMRFEDGLKKLKNLEKDVTNHMLHVQLLRWAEMSGFNEMEEE